MKTFTHRTKKVAIKWVDIDVEMIPIVNWLNSHDYIYTQHCCEGGEEGDEGWEDDNKGNINSCYRPYISFLSSGYPLSINQGNPKTGKELKQIIELMALYGEFDKDDGKSHSKDDRFAFMTFRFFDKNKMREFIKNEL